MATSKKSPEEKQYVGEGRSAVVYLDHDSEGRPLAQKIFTGEGLSKLVLFILTGAANPYTWCEAAMRTAVIRRRLLGRLVVYWFGDKLRLPRQDSWGWNADQLAFELKTELIDGQHCPLQSPVDPAKADYLHDLTHRIMRPLQEYLSQSGFDGLVWQAGRGNPVASNNFMLENPDPEHPRWVWIDLESGVPALFAMNPLATLGYYLPKSVHHGRWLFDDVDTQKLRQYLDDHETGIIQALGVEAMAGITSEVNDLEQAQAAWRDLKRHERGIGYELSARRITPDRADWYRQHPQLWAFRQIAIGVTRGINGLGRLMLGVARWAFNIRYKRLLRRLWHYTKSTRYRWGVARWYVRRKIALWHKRAMLSDSATSLLQHQLHHDDASAYLTDFSVHLAMKGVIKPMVWIVFPLLWASGLISGAVFAFLLVAGGSIGRTGYTLWRFTQSATHHQRRPWVALGIGLFPGIGNMAYPAQLLYSSLDHNGELARFIIYDIAAAIGRKIPIWGGADTRTEHLFNRAGDQAVKWLTRYIRRHPPAAKTAG